MPPEADTVHAHDLIPGSLLSLYNHVIWNGHQFPGPSIAGTHIWAWMTRQRR